MNANRLFRNAFAAAALVACSLALAPRANALPVVIVASYAPPAIPVYEQPLIPGEGYIWTPGYYAWGPDGYYWVDGAWVMPPYVGALWTPGWWGWGTGGYFWHAGYWGRTVGYYGGINYGFGYFGTGFYGGYWNGGHFWYNRAYGHFSPGFHGNFYERRYAGFEGHPGGPAFAAHPPAQYASFNHGGPNHFGTPGAFHGNEQHGFASAGMQTRSGFSAPQAHGFESSRGSFGGGPGAHPGFNTGGSFHGGAPAAGGFHGGAPAAGGFHGGGHR